MTKTELLIEYWERTRHIALPDELEKALEADYTINRCLYTDYVLSLIQVLYLLLPEIKSLEMLEYLHRHAGVAE